METGPSVSTYTAYTAWLDELNRRDLRSIDGRKILVRDGASLEERNPRWESPPVSIESRVWVPAAIKRRRRRCRF
jgi:hypothetical protein